MALHQLTSVAEARGLEISALAAREVTKCFDGVAALGGANLSVPSGRVVALLGPSGCGKTTLLRCIAGLERPDAGEIRLEGRVLSGPEEFVPPEARGIGMVFQDLALFPHLSVRRNVAFGLRRSQRNSARVDGCLALVGLLEHSERMPSTLSGGQQQRVALARALACGPSVILLDEPFSNLDAVLRVQIRAEVGRLLADLGVTALFVTHDQEEAFLLGDSVAVMFDGIVVQQAPPAQLYAAPATRRVAEFVGDANFLPGWAHGDAAETRLGVVPLGQRQHGRVEVLVRPEEVLVAPGADAVVDEVEFYGHDAVCLVRLHDGTRLRVRTLSAPNVQPGDDVGLRFSGRATVAFPVD